MLPGQTSEVASKLRKDGANMARAMTDMLDAMDRKRGKGPQVVRVERVVVHEGGQAIVGNVKGGDTPAVTAAPKPAAPLVTTRLASRWTTSSASSRNWWGGRGYDRKSEAEPHASRWQPAAARGPGGDPRTAPRCGARTRASLPCKGPAMPNGRCRMHGGTSTGPRTPEGLQRIVKARTVHGAYGAEMRELRRLMRALDEEQRRVLELVK